MDALITGLTGFISANPLAALIIIIVLLAIWKLR